MGFYFISEAVSVYCMALTETLYQTYCVSSLKG